jgi:5'-3' exonuclease
MTRVGDVVNAMINYTLDSKDHLKKDGKIFLLYDPIPVNDLGISKVFKYDNNRKSENPDYKANRKLSPLYIDVLTQYQKYFFYRGDNIISVYSDLYEADDYVESIVKELRDTNKKERIACVTTDHDFCRYLDLDIDIINKDWDHPYTREEFFNAYDFLPTISSVTLNKAIFGDESDNIKGAIKIKRSLEMIRNSANDAIKYLGEHDMPLEDLIKEFSIGLSIDTIDIADETPLKTLVANIISMDLNSLVIDHILSNINLIRSRCPSYKKYSHNNPENKVLNAILEESLGRIKVSKKKKFGGIKLK